MLHNIVDREKRLLAAENVEQVANAIAQMGKGFAALVVALLALLAVALGRHPLAEMIAVGVQDAALASMGAYGVAMIVWSWGRDARMNIDAPEPKVWRKVLGRLATGPVLFLPVVLLGFGGQELLKLAIKLPALVSGAR